MERDTLRAKLFVVSPLALRGGRSLLVPVMSSGDGRSSVRPLQRWGGDWASGGDVKRHSEVPSSPGARSASVLPPMLSSQHPRSSAPSQGSVAPPSSQARRTSVLPPSPRRGPTAASRRANRTSKRDRRRTRGPNARYTTIVQEHSRTNGAPTSLGLRDLFASHSERHECQRQRGAITTLSVQCGGDLAGTRSA